MKGFLIGIAQILLGTVILTAQAADYPQVVRIGAPAISGNVQGLWGALGLARDKGWLEEEFKEEGIRFEYPGFKGGGPMVGQALANGQIDFAGNGDMISLIGRASGIRSRLILPGGRLENAYLAARNGSGIQSIADLRGKKVAYTKGNYIQLQVIRILAEEGMTERDIRAVNLNSLTAATALASGDVDALFGSTEVLSIVDRGVGELVYSTRGKSWELTAHAGFLVRDEFAERYPEVTERVVKVLVRTAYWASLEENRQEVFDIWARGHRSRAELEAEYEGQPLITRLNPLLDDFYIAQYKRTEQLLSELRLLRGNRVDVDAWVDSRYLDKALADLGLQDHWTPSDANQNVSSP